MCRLILRLVRVRIRFIFHADNVTIFCLVEKAYSRSYTNVLCTRLQLVLIYCKYYIACNRLCYINVNGNIASTTSACLTTRRPYCTQKNDCAFVKCTRFHLYGGERLNDIKHREMYDSRARAQTTIGTDVLVRGKRPTGHDDTRVLIAAGLMNIWSRTFVPAYARVRRRNYYFP